VSGLSRVVCILVSLACASTVRAHDPYESWASVVLTRDTLELNVSMARSTALQVVDPEKSIRNLTLENFSEHRARFERAATALFVVTSVRTPMRPKKTTAEHTEENDIVFKIVFVRPAPGRLHFHAAFLRKLGQGYGGIIEVSDENGRDLGWEQIAFENPNLEVTVPPSGAPASKKP
jgi:hypothetical protein